MRLAVLFLTAWIATSASASFEFRGYAKSYHIGLFPKRVDGLSPSQQASPLYQSLTAVRAQASWTPSDWLNFEVGYELVPTLQASSGSSIDGLGALFASANQTAGGNRYRLVDTRARLFGGSEAAFATQNLDRLNFRLTLPFGDWTFGRQAVTFGSSRALSPSDVFLPFGLQQLNVEYRIGVDAVRLQIPLGQMGEVDLGGLIGQDGLAANSALWARGRATFWDGDWELVGILWNDAGLVSLGLQRAIWKLGFWAEGAVTLVEAGGENYVRASTGVDYAFLDGPTVFVEYHYNGAGGAQPSDYADLFNSFAYTKGGVFLLGQHYLIPGLSWQITPLWGVTNQFFINVVDPSAFWSVSSEFNLAENWYLDFGLFVTAGQPLTTDGVNLSFGSEYGAYPIFAYGDVRFYF